MTYDDALKIVRRAFKEAIRLHGVDRAKIYEEVRLREGQDDELEEAVNIVGIHDQFSTRH